MASIRVITLGCSKNRVDTEHLLAQLGEEWKVSSESSADAVDVIALNTCGFIGDAKQESIDAVLEAVELKRRALAGKVLVFGCLSERYASDLPGLIPEVDAWFGARDLTPVLEYLGAIPSKSLSMRRRLTDGQGSYAFLKISEGCDRRCSYCAIPYIRGAHRSVPMEDLVEEARCLAARGVRELVLIAQDTTYYGLDLYGKRRLGDLLSALSEIDGIEWLRIHYSYPSDFPEDVLVQMASNPKVCKYLDIPLQHISDTVLDNMHRHIDGAHTRALIGRLRSKVPGVVLRTTMIVGHPGEDDNAFRELLSFVKDARFERLGAFAYSEEEGTWGGLHLEDSVAPSVKQTRLDSLMTLQSGISREYNESRVGKTERVMVDAVQDGATLLCRSQYESPDVDGAIFVRVPDSSAFSPGDFLCVRITSADDYDLTADIMDNYKTPDCEPLTAAGDICTVSTGWLDASTYGDSGMAGRTISEDTEDFGF